MWIKHILFIHSATDGHWCGFPSLAIVNHAAVNVCVQILVGVPDFGSLGIHTEVELLDHRGSLCSVGQGTNKLFSIILHSTSEVKGGPGSLHPRQHLVVPSLLS